MKTYQCDGPVCGTEAKHPYAGWFEISILDRRPMARIPRHFCSARCLAAFARDMAAKADR